MMNKDYYLLCGIITGLLTIVINNVLLKLSGIGYAPTIGMIIYQCITGIAVGCLAGVIFQSVSKKEEIKIAK